MKIIISWSGERSKAVASALRDWLKQVIQAIDPWMSDVDIDKGAQWYLELDRLLKEAKVGIICLTPENLEVPWILFEAGAISRALEKAYVCTYLYKVKQTDIKGPLAQFQHTEANKDDTRKLINTINKSLEEKALEETLLNKIFDKYWPELEDMLEKISGSEKLINLKFILQGESDGFIKQDKDKLNCKYWLYNKETAEKKEVFIGPIKRWEAGYPTLNIEMGPDDMIKFRIENTYNKVWESEFFFWQESIVKLNPKSEKMENSNDT